MCSGVGSQPASCAASRYFATVAATVSGEWKEKHTPRRLAAANMAESRLLPEKYIGGYGRWTGRGQTEMRGYWKNSPSQLKVSGSLSAFWISRVASCVMPLVL